MNHIPITNCPTALVLVPSHNKSARKVIYADRILKKTTNQYLTIERIWNRYHRADAQRQRDKDSPRQWTETGRERQTKNQRRDRNPRCEAMKGSNNGDAGILWCSVFSFLRPAPIWKKQNNGSGAWNSLLSERLAPGEPSSVPMLTRNKIAQGQTRVHMVAPPGLLQ